MLIFHFRSQKLHEKQLYAALKIILESNAYLRPNFLLNADFQISKRIFNPCNFSQCWKGRYYCFEVPYLNFFCVILIIALEVTCYYLLLHLSIDHILTICWQMDRQIDIDNPEFYFCFKTCIDNQYALHWTSNVYRNMLTRIFTPSLYFQCVFTDFQCVITLLRALSVALFMCTACRELYFQTIQEGSLEFIFVCAHEYICLLSFGTSCAFFTWG